MISSFGGHKVDRRILFLKSYIEENIHTQITIDELAKNVNLSPAYLHQLFKAETNETIYKYIQNLKLERCCYLLKNTFLRIKEVGVKVGIQDQAMFSKVFKKKYGVSPTVFRQSEIPE